MLKHNEEYQGILYKYDLPIENKAIEFKSQLIVQEEIPNTSVENLYETLEIDKDTAYESFIIKLNQTYNNEIDMYGDIRKAGETNLKVSNVEKLIYMSIGARVRNPHPLCGNRKWTYDEASPILSQVQPRHARVDRASAPQQVPSE